jgi:hypothetical protein
MSFKPRGATCVVEQLWPGITVDVAFAQLERITSAASAIPAAARPRVLGATLIPEDETLFTWCVASSIDSVRSLLVTSGVSYDRVLQVVHAMPQRAQPVSGRSSP